MPQGVLNSDAVPVPSVEPDSSARPPPASVPQVHRPPGACVGDGEVPGACEPVAVGVGEWCGDGDTLVSRAMARTSWFAASETYTVVPYGASATPDGLPKSALPPTPSAIPLMEPASVVTTAEAATMSRTRFPELSATYTFPQKSAATARGKAKRALLPTPSTVPAVVPVLLPPPASVVTVFVPTATARTRLLE